jgi:hypothetical protein
MFSKSLSGEKIRRLGMGGILCLTFLRDAAYAVDAMKQQSIHRYYYYYYGPLSFGGTVGTDSCALIS